MDLSLPPLARRGEAPDTFTGWGGIPMKAHSEGVRHAAIKGSVDF